MLRADEGSTGDWGIRPVRKEELLGWEFEAGIRWDNSGNKGEVVLQMEGDER